MLHKPPRSGAAQPLQISLFAKEVQNVSTLPFLRLVHSVHSTENLREHLDGRSHQVRIPLGVMESSYNEAMHFTLLTSGHVRIGNQN